MASSTMIKFPDGRTEEKKVISVFEGEGLKTYVFDTDKKEANGNYLTEVSTLVEGEDRYRNILDDPTWNKVKKTFLVPALHQGKADTVYRDPEAEIMVTEYPSRELYLRPANYESLVANYENYKNNKEVSAQLEQVSATPTESPEVAPVVDTPVMENTINPIEQVETPAQEIPFGPSMETANTMSEESAIPSFESGIAETPVVEQVPIQEAAPTETPVIDLYSAMDTVASPAPVETSIAEAPVIEQAPIQEVAPTVEPTNIVDFPQAPVTPETPVAEEQNTSIISSHLARLDDLRNREQEVLTKFEQDIESFKNEERQILAEIQDLRSISMKAFENSQNVVETQQGPELTRVA